MVKAAVRLVGLQLKPPSSSSLFNYAIVEIEIEDVLSDNDFTQKILNLIGKSLGFGDIRSTNSFESVMEGSS